jgi:hypothetical protein
LVIVPVPLGAVKATLTEFVLETVATTLVGTLDIVLCVIEPAVPAPDELLGVTMYV